MSSASCTPPISIAVKESTNVPESIDTARFSIVRKGYDKREVRDYLQELETAFRDLETWSHQAKVQLAEAEERLSTSKADAEDSVDDAMFAVFDAKDRILDKARRRAEQIEAEALEEAEEIKARAVRIQVTFLPPRGKRPPTSSSAPSARRR